MAEKKALEKNYTNLQLLYGLKIFFLVLVGAYTISQTWNSFENLVVSVIIFTVPVGFDMIVLCYSNNGQKTKMDLCCKAMIGFIIVILFLAIWFMFSRFDLFNDQRDCFSIIFRFSLVFIGFFAPYLELRFNKPEDE